MELVEKSVSVQETADGQMVLVRPDAEYVIVNQDEKIHHSNDVEKT